MDLLTMLPSNITRFRATDITHPRFDELISSQLLNGLNINWNQLRRNYEFAVLIYNTLQ